MQVQEDNLFTYKQFETENVYLDKLLIQNFRNTPAKIYQFSKGLNCIYGPNGSGKTNLLEAVYYLYYKKSFRKNTSFKQMLSVNCGKPEILIQSSFDKNGKLEAYSKTISELGVVNKHGKLPSSSNCIIINPIDSLLFNTKSDFRRNLFDYYFSLLDTNYKSILKDYEKLVRHKNKLLKNFTNNNKKLVLILNQQISVLSKNLIDMRLVLIEKINSLLKENYFKIFSAHHHISFEYDSKFKGLSSDVIYNEYLLKIDKEIILGRHYYGVHLDDYQLKFDEMNAYEFCSLGQQKSSYLSLIFSFAQLIKEKSKSYPLILIDDISSELDSVRWQNLKNYLETKKFQVILTTANEAFLTKLKEDSPIKEICFN